jgi:hypothetical protein
MKKTKMRDLQKITAETISLFLSAPLVSFYAFILLLFSLHPTTSLSLFSIFTFFASIFPVAIVFYMTKKDIIPDVYASVRQTRTKPLLSVLACQIVGILLLMFLKAPQTFVSLMTSFLIISFVMTIITQVWKISIHTSGITGVATFLVYYLGSSMLPFFMLVLPVGWARIKLKAHNLAQVVAGAVLPLILVNLQLIFF